MGRHVPVPMGSHEETTLHTSMVAVSDVQFAPNTILPAHTHERTIFGVMLQGAFRSHIQHHQLECTVESAWTEPYGEPHANFVGTCGARVLAIQPDHTRTEFFEGLAPLLADVRLVHCAGLHATAQRISRELRFSDALTPIAIDALVLNLLVAASRLDLDRSHATTPPSWLLVARDMLRAAFASPPGLQEVAQTVGVSPSHLAHSFKRYFATTPGEYLREVRAEWAASQVTDSQRPLAEIALTAGYSDQAHFTRDLRRVFGATPLLLRSRAQRSRSA